MDIDHLKTILKPFATALTKLFTFSLSKKFALLLETRKIDTEVP